MELVELVSTVANILLEFDASLPVHANARGEAYLPGIGPFSETKLVKSIRDGFTRLGIEAETMQKPDLSIGQADWAIEFKIARPYGNNGKEAENWSVNLLHPYRGNVSALADALKLTELNGYTRKAIFVIGYEHLEAKISLDPLFQAFEILATQMMSIRLGVRIESRRSPLVHPVHQVVRCVAWEILS